MHRFILPLLLVLMMLLLAACSGTASSTPGVTSAKSTARPQASVQNTPQAEPFSKAITYVALGASDAVGVGSNEPGSQGYVPLIAEHLPKGSHTLNLGISGIHLHEALQQELPLALTTSPQLITIWLVVNDFVAGVTYTNYAADLKSLLSQLRQKTQARIVMANLPDLTRLPIFSRQTSAQKTQTLATIKQWNQGIKSLAQTYSVALVNLFQDGSEITAHPEYISGDGFHPSARGYIRLEQYFWQAIQA